MKKEKLVSTLYFIASAGYLLVSVMNFMDKNDRIWGVFWLCLSFFWLVMGIMNWKRKSDKNINGEKERTNILICLVIGASLCLAALFCLVAELV